MVVQPDLSGLRRAKPSLNQGARTSEDSLAEAINLARSVQLDVVYSTRQTLKNIHRAMYFGTGKVRELGELAKRLDVEVLIVNGALSAVQQRNLERTLALKVIDRTGLILEIFGARARTREGRLQVELAHLTYQKGRLVRSWTHLERQRGGFGFLGGPGETQIEADRRALDGRISKIRRQLESVVKTRNLHRRSRMPYPIVALVGYTNAGKSTLFNRLTNSAVVARDQLFATLDPTMRAVTLPSGKKVILSDTVGFIADLPTHLVAAFRATLEEVVEADILLHVRDVAHPESEEQRHDVLDILARLGITPEQKPILEVLNKSDLLDGVEREFHQNLANRNTDKHLLSSLNGDGCDSLLELLDNRLSMDDVVLEISLEPDQQDIAAWLYRQGHVLHRRDDGARITLTTRLSQMDLGRLKKKIPGQKILFPV